MYEKSIITYACIIYYAYICDMRNKTRFKQIEFQPDYFSLSNYLVVVELQGVVPTASYTVLVPEPISPFEKFQHFSN